MSTFDILMNLFINRTLIELNFYFTANKQTYKIRVNTREKLWQYLYRFSVNEKELNGIIIFGVSYKDSKLDIDTKFDDTEIKGGDTLIVDSEIPSKESENDNTIKQYIKPFSNMLQGVYEGQLKNGKPEGNGRFFNIMGIFYKGEWNKGKKNGKGFERGMMGEIYEGEFKNDKRNGKGTLKLADGEIYEGDWVDNIKQGKGKIKYPNGDIYEGDFKNDLGNGKGKFKWINGNEYEGEVKDDLMDGKGILKWKEGYIYEGDFLKDQRTGKGVFKMNNGIRYEGEFLDGQFNGKGIVIYPKEGSYEGEWKENKKHGKGIFKFNNGDIYEGDFLDNSIDGFGKMTYANGKIENGLWEYNKFMEDYNKDYSFSLKCIKTVNNPNKTVNILLQLKDGRIISGSEDGMLNIYNKDNYEIDLSIKEHSNKINSCIQLNDERIVTCSNDCTMKIIKLTNDNKYALESTLESPEKMVLNVIEIKNNEIISILSDKTMKVWDLTTFKNIKTIETNCDNIFKLDENEFITSSMENKCVKFWNTDNYQNINTINDLNIFNFVHSMCLFEDNMLFVGGLDILYLIDIKKYQILKTFKINGFVLSIQKCLDGNILCAINNRNKNNNIIKYKYDKENLTKIFEKKKAHNNPILNCIQLKNGIIVSAEGKRLEDSFEIKFWKILEESKEI